MPVEMIPDRRPLVSDALAKLTDNFCEPIGVKAHSVKLEKYLDKGEKIDYMPFDICGNFTAWLARWFYLYQEYFANEMRFPITLQIGNKRSQVSVFKAVENATDGEYYNIVEKILRKQNTELYFSNGMPTKTAMESLYSQIYLLYCSMPNKDLIFKSLNIYNNSEIVERQDRQRGKLAEDMVLIDIEVKDRENPKNAIGHLRSILNCYNEMTKGENVELKHRERKTKKKTNKTPRVVYVKMSDIAKYKTYDNIPTAIKALITKQAIKNNTDVKMTHAGYKAYLKRLANVA